MTIATINPIADYYVDAYLEHHGVLGMHWGIRRQRRLALLKRASQKNGFRSGIAKTRAIIGFGYKLGPIDFVKGHGLSGGFARKAARIGARDARVAAGRATVSDRLHRIGAFRLSNLIPVSGGSRAKMGSTKSDTAAVAGLGAVYTLNALSFIGKRSMRQL